MLILSEMRNNANFPIWPKKCFGFTKHTVLRFKKASTYKSCLPVEVCSLRRKPIHLSLAVRTIEAADDGGVSIFPYSLQQKLLENGTTNPD